MVLRTDTKWGFQTKNFGLFQMDYRRYESHSKHRSRH